MRNDDIYVGFLDTMNKRNLSHVDVDSHDSSLHRLLDHGFSDNLVDIFFHRASLFEQLQFQRIDEIESKY